MALFYHGVLIWLQMTKLLQHANTSFNTARNYLTFRGRRNEAYLEYAVANDIVNIQVRRNPEYPQMVTSTSQNNQLYQSLRKNLVASKEQFQNIRKIIIQENQRNGTIPQYSVTGVVQNGSGSSGSRPQSGSSGVFSGDSQSTRHSLDSGPAKSDRLQ